MAKMRRLFAVLGVTALAMTALGVGGAGAGLFGCSYPTVSKPFSTWGDWASYYLSPGGGFEPGTTPWKLAGGAAVAAGNEPFFANAPTDTRSLRLVSGATAQGPSSCIFGSDLKVRMFARSADSAPLRVEIMVPGALGLLRVVTAYTVATTPDWQPTISIVNLANVLSLTSLSTSNISVRLVAPSGSTVDVDDVFIDPTWFD